MLEKTTSNGIPVAGLCNDSSPLFLPLVVAWTGLPCVDQIAACASVSSCSDTCGDRRRFYHFNHTEESRSGGLSRRRCLEEAKRCSQTWNEGEGWNCHDTIRLERGLENFFICRMWDHCRKYRGLNKGILWNVFFLLRSRPPLSIWGPRALLLDEFQFNPKQSRYQRQEATPHKPWEEKSAQLPLKKNVVLRNSQEEFPFDSTWTSLRNTICVSKK